MIEYKNADSWLTHTEIIDVAYYSNSTAPTDESKREWQCPIAHSKDLYQTLMH